MASIGTLSVNVIAQTAQFASGMAKAQGSLGKFAGKAKQFGAGLISSLGFVGATAAVYGFTSTIRSSFGELDKIAKDSRRLGIAPETLQQFAHAADITGVSTEAVSKGLFRMQKNISDAEIGLSTAKRAFGQLGLEASELKALSPEQQFGLIADRLNMIGNESDRTRIAMDLFGRSGIELKTLLDEGSAGIAKLFAERAELGELFSAEELARIENANDAWARMSTSIKTVAQELAINAAPAMEDFANFAREAVAGISGKKDKGLAIQQQAGGLGDAIASGNLAGINKGLADLAGNPMAGGFYNPLAGPARDFGKALGDSLQGKSKAGAALRNGPLPDVIKIERAETPAELAATAKREQEAKLQADADKVVAAGGAALSGLFGLARSGASQGQAAIAGLKKQIAPKIEKALGDEFSGEGLIGKASSPFQAIKDIFGAIGRPIAEAAEAPIERLSPVAFGGALQQGTAAAFSQALRNREASRGDDEKADRKKMVAAGEEAAKLLGRLVEKAEAAGGKVLELFGGA